MKDFIFLLIAIMLCLIIWYSPYIVGLSIFVVLSIMVLINLIKLAIYQLQFMKSMVHKFVDKLFDQIQYGI